MSRAFTLIEVLVAAALSAVLLLAITRLYVVYNRVVLVQQASIKATLGASGIVDAARVAGMQARQVVAAHTFAGANYSSGTTTAIFELPSIDASGAIVGGAYDYIGIHASGTEAYRFADAAPGSSRASGEKRLTDVLDALSFTYDNPSFPSVTSVTVSATTSAAVRGETTYTHMRERIDLRNI